MKREICNRFNIISTSINGQVVAQYNTFLEKLNYFNQQGGNDNDLINFVYQISHGLLKDLFHYMKDNVGRYKDQVDLFGFSALYYYNLRPISISAKSDLKSLGFKEVCPDRYKVEHFKSYSYYSHNEGTKSTAFVFLGKDKTGALDVNAVHVLFMKGYNVISVDARISNIQLKEVYNIVYQHSDEDISLFYIGSHGAESVLRKNMHALPILGYNEERKETNGNVVTTFSIKDSISATKFIRGISYTADGYPSWISKIFIDTPWFFPAGKKINVFLASCNGQLSVFDTKYVLAEGSEILILGENHCVNGIRHIHHVTNQDEINLLDSIARDNSITKIDLKTLMDAYLTSVSVEDHIAGSPYYLKIIGHKLWGTPITKEFSCLTVLKEKTKEIITMRQEKNQEYIKLLALACNHGYNQSEPMLEDMWTKEYIKKVTMVIQQDVEETRKIVYGNIWYYGNILYEGGKELFYKLCEEVNYYSSKLYNDVLGNTQSENVKDSYSDL